MLMKKCKCGLVIPMNKRMCNDCLKASKQKYSKGYKPPRKDYKEQQFYVSKQWFKVRDSIRKRDKYLCMLCYADGCIKPVKAVHHIIELKEDWNKRFDSNNLICVCSEHHTLIHIIYLNPKDKPVLQEHLKSLIGQAVD